MEKEIESVVLTELHGTHGLDSLLLQNHVYGCFILMEDIVESTVTLSGTTITNDGYTFDIDTQFSEIGIRYGFLMDTSLDVTNYQEEYKKKWMELFRYLNDSHDMTVVERVEDAVLALLQKNVKEEDAFLMSALETGTLSRGWQDRFIKMIKGRKQLAEVSVQSAEVSVQSAESPVKKEEEEEQPTTGVSRAHIEKPVKNKHGGGLHKTRRQRKDIPSKKNLSSTRRSCRI